ncbi:hypothetical protein Emag_001922 [Eimeria magna]
MAQSRPENTLNPATSPSPSHHLRSQQTRLKSRMTRRRSTGDDESRWSASAPPPEDRDEFSDDEEVDVRSGKRCWAKVAKIFKAVFPDSHAFRWMLLPYIVLLVIYLIDLGSDDYPRETKLVIFELDEDTAQRAEQELPGHFPEIVRYVEAASLARDWFLVLLRVILIILLTNALPEKWQILSALFTTVDPQLVYLLWSLYTFGLWNATFRQSQFPWPVRLSCPRKWLAASATTQSQLLEVSLSFSGVYSWDRADVNGGRVALYYSTIFRGGLLMTRGLLKVSFALWVATILLALRRLLFRALVFRFELGFMKNTNGELVTYLTRYALFRRFNIRWNDFYAAQQKGKRAGSPWPGKSGLPSQLKPNSIEKSTKSRLHNWTLIQYVLHFPPALFLQGKYIELTSKLITRTVAENMFTSFMAYAKSDKGQGQPEKTSDLARVASPLQKRDSQRLQFSASPDEEGGKETGRSVPPLPSTSKGTTVHPGEINKKKSTEIARSRAHSGASDSQRVEGAKLDWPAKGHQPDVPLLTVSEPKPESPTFKMEANLQKAPMQLECDEDEPERDAVNATSRGTSMFWLTREEASDLHSMPNMQALPDVPPTIHDSIQPQEMAMTSSARAGSAYSISDEALPGDPADMSPSSSVLCSKQQVSRCTSLAQGGEDLSNLPLQPHLRCAPVHGALDYTVNSRLLANLTRADVWCGPPTSSNIPTSIDDLREKVKSQRAEREAAAQASSQDNQYFDKSFIDQFLKPEDSAEFMRLVDFGDAAAIFSFQFAGCSLLLRNALGYLYEQFVTAVIFVALTNPYNVGDRIVVRKDRVLFVSCIRTYTTEFSDVYGSLVVVSNSILWGQQIVNESRSRNASFEFPIRVSFRTRLQQIRLLEIRIKHALAARPLDFVKDSFSIFLADVQPGRWISVRLVATWLLPIRTQYHTLHLLQALRCKSY